MKAELAVFEVDTTTKQSRLHMKQGAWRWYAVAGEDSNLDRLRQTGNSVNIDGRATRQAQKGLCIKGE